MERKGGEYPNKMLSIHGEGDVNKVYKRGKGITVRTLPSYVCKSPEVTAGDTSRGTEALPKRESRNLGITSDNELCGSFPIASKSTILRTRDEADFGSGSSCLHWASHEFMKLSSKDVPRPKDEPGRFSDSVVYLSTSFKQKIACSLTRPSAIVVDGNEPCAFPLFKCVEDEDSDAMYEGVLGAAVGEPPCQSLHLSMREGAAGEHSNPEQFRFPTQKLSSRDTEKKRLGGAVTHQVFDDAGSTEANPFEIFSRSYSKASEPKLPRAHEPEVVKQDGVVLELDFMADMAEWFDGHEVERSFADMVTGSPEFTLSSMALGTRA